ncbi:hypothetical protein EC988_002743 [Linderina pennispora]|nr:hypothetical protein EC988_002743 [Linderina pennispora]
MNALMWNQLTSIWFLTYLWVFLARKFWHWLLEPMGPAQKIQWDKQLVVLTGGSHGVGLSLLNQLSLTGARIAVIDLTEPPEELASTFFYKCDLADTNQITQTVARINNDLGIPTILVNNAGAVCTKLIHTMTECDMQRIMQINALAPMHLTRLLLPGMLTMPRGHIVFVSSTLGFSSTPQLSTYCASKAALACFRDSLRLELRYRVRSERIKTTILHLGRTDGDMLDHVIDLTQVDSESDRSDSNNNDDVSIVYAIPAPKRLKTSPSPPPSTIQTSAYTEVPSQPNTILVLAEGRSVYSELAFSFIDMTTSKCWVTQYADTASFAHTIYSLTFLRPHTILVPRAMWAGKSKCMRTIRRYLPWVSVQMLDRRLFDDGAGMRVVSEIDLAWVETVLEG